jgi:hypothetical protein
MTNLRQPRPDQVSNSQEEEGVAKEFDEVETRQGDRRRMNLWVLFIGVPLAVVLMIAAYVLWS